MEFYNGKDGLAIMELITKGHTVDEAIAIINPTTITLDVSPEVEEFCADLDAGIDPETL